MDTRYWDIAVKYLEGKASAAEEAELHTWRAEDPAHEEQYRVQEKLWALTELQPVSVADTDVAWAKVRTKLQPQAGTQHIKQEANTIPLFRIAMRVAASVAFLLTFVWLINFFFTGYGKQVAQAINNPVEVLLPDGSRVTLNRNSKLTYARKFSDAERFMTLEGEAFFEVERDELRPFIIETGAVQARVLGTSFNLRAYAQEQQAELVVVTGKVAFAEKNTAKEAIVVAGQSASLNLETKQLHTFIQTDANSWAWKTGLLQFEARPLAEVLPHLERYYSVKLQLKSADMAGCRFTGTFTNASLQEVLDVLQATLQLQYIRQSTDVYLLTGEGCSL